VITIFSQYGEVVDVNLPRDKETGKSKGFGFLMYEDQRSTVLAVDNLNGAQILERVIRVDHVKNYKQKRVKNEEGEWVDPEEQSLNAKPELVISACSSDFEGVLLSRKIVPQMMTAQHLTHLVRTSLQISIPKIPCVNIS
jgi:RNA recognition motif-containing protein